MTADDRVRWDTIYRDLAKKPYPPPDPILLEYTPIVRDDVPQHALDVAGGVGQNGLWLAEQGYITDIVDVSRVALYRARVEMTVRNLRNINLLQIDLDHADLKRHFYDVVCVFRFLKRDTLPAIREAVKPGGRLIYETYNLSYLARVPEFNPRFLLESNELLEYFQGWNILHHEEFEHLTRLVAVRPPESESITCAKVNRPRKDTTTKFEW